MNMKIERFKLLQHKKDLIIILALSRGLGMIFLIKRVLMYCLDHEIVLELGTPARNHMIFPDKEVKIKLVSFKLLNKEKVAIPLKRSFEDLPPNKTLVPKLILKERIGLQSGGSSKA
ncbi:hypothetical protein P8452_69407 [Trifolium repens]|nr:hypothetical protein P8452_69407 [Trifolium repens]